MAQQVRVAVEVASRPRPPRPSGGTPGTPRPCPRCRPARCASRAKPSGSGCAGTASATGFVHRQTTCVPLARGARLPLVASTAVSVRPQADVPLHHALRSRLRELIADARAGDRLPSERTLSERWGVARMTVRTATDALVAEGLVERRHGSGTYVLPQPFVRFLGLTSFTQDMRDRGLVPSSRLLAFEVLAADAVARRGAPDRARRPVVRFTRLRLGSDVPMAVETTWIASRARARPRAHRPRRLALRAAGAPLPARARLGQRDHRARAARPVHPPPPGHPGTTGVPPPAHDRFGRAGSGDDDRGLRLPGRSVPARGERARWHGTGPPGDGGSTDAHPGRGRRPVRDPPAPLVERPAWSRCTASPGSRATRWTRWPPPSPRGGWGAGSGRATGSSWGCPPRRPTGRRRIRLCRHVNRVIGADEVWLADDSVTCHAGALSLGWGVSITAGTGVACLVVPETGEPSVLERPRLPPGRRGRRLLDRSRGPACRAPGRRRPRTVRRRWSMPPRGGSAGCRTWPSGSTAPSGPSTTSPTSRRTCWRSRMPATPSRTASRTTAADGAAHPGAGGRGGRRRRARPRARSVPVALGGRLLGEARLAAATPRRPARARADGCRDPDRGRLVARWRARAGRARRPGTVPVHGARVAGAAAVPTPGARREPAADASAGRRYLGRRDRARRAPRGRGVAAHRRGRRPADRGHRVGAHGPRLRQRSLPHARGGAVSTGPVGWCGCDPSCSRG